jgi:hypothetical protein
MQHSSDLSSLLPFERLRLHEKILRDASSAALTTILQDGGKTKVEELQVLSTTDRAVWFNMTKLIPTATKSFPILKQVVDVVDDQVVLLQPLKFRQLYGSADELQHTTELIPLEKFTRSSRCTAIRRWQKLWAPCDARLALVGVSHNGRTVYCPVAQAHLLADHWGRVFSAKPIDEELAKSMSSSYQPPMQSSHVPPPSTEDIATTIRMSRHSSPGLAGLPFLAWAATGQKGCET